MQSLFFRSAKRLLPTPPVSRRALRLRPRPRFFHHTVPRFVGLNSCPVCAKPLPSPAPACNKCWNIFALPPDLTHHELLGLNYEPNPFIVDIPTLKKHFRETQSICHPDTWATRNPNKQDAAQALSSRINHAYQTLLEPLARAEYILDRNHVPISEGDQVHDMMFMAEIMEARETIDDAETPSEVEALFEENQGKILEVIKDLEGLIGESDWVSAKAAAIRLRYLQGIRRAAKRWLDNHA